MYDVAIIGGGVIGCSIARYLSMYDRKVVLLERCTDICEGTSKANSGIVHGGYDAPNGTMKALMNVKGSLMMEELSKQLDFHYRKNGSLVLKREDQDEAALIKLYDRGIKNGVEGLRIIERDEILDMEPAVAEGVDKALYVPSGAIVDPFMLTCAMAENAAVNGVEFRREAEVRDIREENGGYILVTSAGDIRAKYVINAAGVYADRIHAMACRRDDISIKPVRGEYCLFDKEVGGYVKHTLFQLPSEKGKGVLVTPTVHGNLMVGPTSDTADDKEGVNTTREGLESILETALRSVADVPKGRIITSFAGLRAKEKGGDFIIGFAPDAENFIDVAGIESPGLSAAPAIGEYVAKLLNDRDPADLKSDFIAERSGIPSMNLASDEERNSLIAEDPAYANIICRCELVSEAEILQAIRRPVGARTVDAVKRRVRAGMGRCQGGFCQPKVVDILSRELSLDPVNILKADRGSGILKGLNKEPWREDGRQEGGDDI